MTDSAMRNLQASLSKSQELAEKMTSGRRIYRPSDDATGAVSALQHRNTKRANEQYVRNAQDGIGWLETADKALQSSISTLRVAYTKTLQGANDSSGQIARNTLAGEVEGLRDTLTALANTQFAGRPVFGGTDASEVAFNPSGTYAANNGAVYRQINETDKVQVNVDGEAAFSSSDGSETYHEVLSEVAAALRGDGGLTGPAQFEAIQEGIGKIQDLEESMKTALTGLGTRYQRIESAVATGGDKVLNYQSRIAEIESIDLAQTIMEMQMQEVAHKAALGATAKVMQPTLMDFLR